MASAETHTEMRPPRYTSERPLEARSCSKDKAALRIARKAFGVLRTRRTNAKQRRDGTDIREAADDVVNSHVEEEKQAGPSEEATTRVPENSSPEPFFYGDNPPIWLGMSSMYDGTGEWPKKKDPEKLAKQYSWSNIGFPRDESLVLSSYEKDTLIDRTMPTVAALTETVRLIRTRPSEKIADGGKAKRSMEGQRIIDDFTMNGSTVTSVRFLDVDIFANSRRETYRTCKTSTEFEKAVTEGICEQPALDVEQWAAAYVLLAKGGDIGGRVNDYWTRARDLARQQLHVKPELEADIRQQMKTATSNDHAFTEMLSVVREAIKIKTANPYFQSRRDAYAVEQGLFHYIDSDITMVFDKHGVVIAFQCSDVFRKLLDGGVQAAVTKDFENFSTRQPVPIPDMTRHGLHYIDWLAERPELDFRNPRNNPRLAKSGVYHFGARCPAGDPTGNQEPDLTKDSGKRVWEDRGVRSQLKTLHFNALGACTELVTFFFDLLDHELLKEYQKVATEVATLDHQPFATRHSGDPFSMRALLINLMTHDHRDESDWKRGFAGLVAVAGPADQEPSWLCTALSWPRAVPFYHEVERQTVCGR
ncbi:hypothetical protein F4778DRAFT_774274 [Xylariomycetidae sp. FL2044]|nr:hypothetical protein F4778DRAFT_774274 [Xylariomycetidae sp. FL2044]